MANKNKNIPPKVEISAKKKLAEPAKEPKQFSELVIKEIMVQKQCSREEALKILEAHR